MIHKALVLTGANLAFVYIEDPHIRQMGDTMEERRINQTDRRQRTDKLPLRDNNGVKVALERRYFPDRRKSHYNPKW